MRPHGDYRRYTHGGCRCAACCAANTAHHNAYNHRTGRHRPKAQYLAERFPEPPPHGTESRYQHQRCRCDKCREAARVARARRRAKAAA